MVHGKDREKPSMSRPSKGRWINLETSLPQTGPLYLYRVWTLALLG